MRPASRDGWSARRPAAATIASAQRMPPRSSRGTRRHTRAGRCRAESALPSTLPRAGRRARALDQAFTQPALTPQPLLHAAHLAAVALMIVAEQVQQAMQCENFELNPLRMSRLARLTSSNAAGDDDVAEEGAGRL